MRSFIFRRNQENITFAETRCRRLAGANKAENIYACPLVAYLLVLLFVVIDLFCMKTLWNTVQVADSRYVWLVSVACAAALDVPMAIAAVALKGYRQGISTKFRKNTTVVLAVGVFCAAFAFSFYFRIATKDLTFATTESVLSETIAKYANETTTAASDTATVMAAALFNAVIPLLTSLASFVVSFYSADPLGKKIRSLQEYCYRIQDAIHAGERQLEIMRESDAYYDRETEAERERYEICLRRLDAEEMNLKLQARQILMEEIATPEAVTSLTKSSAQVKEQYKDAVMRDSCRGIR